MLSAGFPQHTSESADALAEKSDKTGQNLSYSAANKARNVLDFFYWIAIIPPKIRKNLSAHIIHRPFPHPVENSCGKPVWIKST